MLEVPTINLTETGRNITRLRVAAKLTVRELQTMLGFASPQAIYKWQHGTALPTLDNLVALAAIFDVSIEEILVINSELKAKSVWRQYQNS